MRDVLVGVPVDVPVGIPVEVREHKRLTGSEGVADSGRTNGPYRSALLSRRDQLIVQTVQRFTQVSVDQLTRLYFADHAPAWQRRRCNKALARLMHWEEPGPEGRAGRPLLASIAGTHGGARGGSTGNIYIPATSNATIPNPHMLDITEVYVRLVERQRLGQCEVLAYEPEWYERVAGVELKPDAMVHLRLSPTREHIAYLEIDRGTQWRTRLAQKMRRYVQAYNLGPDDMPFPRVMFVVPHEERARLVAGVAKQQEVPQLFTVCRFQEAADLLTA